MLATDELISKALTQTTQVQALIPQIWASQIETNLRKREVFQQSTLVNTDLTVPGAGDKVYIPSLPDIAPAAALTEGTDMTPIALSNASSVPLTPSEIGIALDISRKAMDRMQYDAVSLIMDRLSYSMTLKIEDDIVSLFNKNVPGTVGSGFANGQLQTIYVTPYVSGSYAATPRTTTTITATDTFNDKLIMDGLTWLRQQNNMPWDDGYYRLYISPAQYESLLLFPQVREDIRFASPQTVLNGEVGSLYGCRIIVNNFLKTTNEGSGGTIPVTNAMLLAPRWSCIAYKRRPELVVDPTLYDLGRRRRFGVFADYDVQLLHNERAVVLKSA